MSELVNQGDTVFYVHEIDYHDTELGIPNVSTALVTDVRQEGNKALGIVDLIVFQRNGFIFKLRVPMDPNKKRGSWHHRS